MGVVGAQHGWGCREDGGGDVGKRGGGDLTCSGSCMVGRRGAVGSRAGHSSHMLVIAPHLRHCSLIGQE